MQDNYQPRQKKSSPLLWVVIVAVVIAAGFYWLKQAEPKKPLIPERPLVIPEANVTVSSTAVSSVAPIETYEPPVTVSEEPLPDLNESDLDIQSALDQLNVNGLMALLVPEHVLRKFVLAVNNVSEGKVNYEYRPVVSPPPPFAVETFSIVVNDVIAEQARVSANNFPRYQPYVTALTALDPVLAANVYRRFYPLLEQAFAELGLKKPNFHSVLIAAIDNVLAAPEANGDLLLVQPKIFYQYADPVLEQLPQTHKLMLRMGPDNARQVKSSLRALRQELVKQP
jgi:hypothetical protein